MAAEKHGGEHREQVVTDGNPYTARDKLWLLRERASVEARKAEIQQKLEEANAKRERSSKAFHAYLSEERNPRNRSYRFGLVDRGLTPQGAARVERLRTIWEAQEYEKIEFEGAVFDGPREWGYHLDKELARCNVALEQIAEALQALEGRADGECQHFESQEDG